jgi:hypothetical protein
MWRLGSHFSDVPPRVLPKIHCTLLPPENNLSFLLFISLSFITDACIAYSPEEKKISFTILTPFSGGNIEGFLTKFFGTLIVSLFNNIFCLHTVPLAWHCDIFFGKKSACKF